MDMLLLGIGACFLGGDLLFFKESEGDESDVPPPGTFHPLPKVHRDFERAAYGARVLPAKSSMQL